jgi:hypothetical protein
MTRPTEIKTNDEVKAYIDKMQDRHGNIFFYQSSGCCDGSALMLYRDGDFLLGDADILVGNANGVPFYVHRSQYETYKDLHPRLDVHDGRGPAFSLDSVENRHFTIHWDA